MTLCSASHGSSWNDRLHPRPSLDPLQYHVLPTPMRVLLVSVTLFALCSPLAVCAPFKVPQDVYRVEQFEEAQAAAQKSVKPIGFLLADPKVEWKADAITSMLRTLRSKVVLVFVVSGTGDWKKLPANVQQALNSPDAGSFLPCAVVFSPDMKTHIASMRYSNIDNEVRRVAREAEKRIVEATAKMQKERKTFDSIFKKSN